MGTHPIFESDFDCLTDWKYGRIQVHERDLAQEAIGNDALLATGSRMAVQKSECHSPCITTHPPRKGATSRLQGHSESASDVVDVRSLAPRVRRWESPCTRVSSCNLPVGYSRLPRSVSAATAVPFASSTRTGLARTQPSSTLRYC